MGFLAILSAIATVLGFFASVYASSMATAPGPELMFKSFFIVPAILTILFAIAWKIG